ncbi:MAG: polysaccharide deacetylase family protein [Rhodospirillales bacterium]|nr:MAG: polysaccharide deacetylase family protein [Rhodospirillales bacterium]
MQPHDFFRQALALGTLALATAISAGPSLSADSAAILMYHRFGEDGFPSTNVRIEQFEDHIRTLTSGRYTVLPVAEIVAALREGRDLPDRTVGITIDDAYRSVYTEAFPRLKAAGLPFTLFIATDSVDRGLAGFLTWDQIREMRDAGNDVGAHSASHLHMTEASAETNRAEMTRSLQRLKEELGTTPTLFAYPYGEASIAVWNVVREFGFTTAFGQHSGTAHATSQDFYLPRFALNETYSDSENFTLRINTRALPVADVTPADPELRHRNPPHVGFTVGPSIPSLLGLACYHSQFGAVDIEQLGTHRVEIRFPAPLEAGRTRLNCTKPAEEGRWYWYGTQFYVPAE